jgi:uncharacterized protein DUF6798
VASKPLSLAEAAPAGGTVPAPALDEPGWLRLVEAATLATLLAVAGTSLIGYRFGDSNHGITVPILKRLMDPALYPGDVMVATAESFPTVFYRLLALLLPGPGSIPAAFFFLYVATMAATFAGIYRIGRWAGGDAAGTLAVLFAVPVRIGLAGEALYRPAFSHSHMASALAIWAMAWFLEGRRFLPLLVLSLGAYNHLLYSVYVLVPMLLVVLWERRAAGTPRTLRLLAAGVVPLLPLLLWAVARGTPMTPEWLEMLRVRSSHHSFPSAFLSDLPEAAALLALGALFASLLSFERRRLVALFVLATAFLFVVGTVFTEWMPLKAVLQLQPHRAWRFLMVLLQAVIAAGIVAGYRQGGFARAVAAATAVLLFVPGLEVLLPAVVAVQAIANRPVAAPWARLAAAAVLVLVRWGGRAPSVEFLADLLPHLVAPLVMGAAALAVVVAVGRQLGGTSRRVLAAGAALGTLLWLTPQAYATARVRWEAGGWREAQDWARRSTPKDAVFLTPPREAGFRVFSERTVVGEWKDGTQQYFDDAFVREWGDRMQALRGDAYASLPDRALLDLAARYGASYIVLPARPIRPGLVPVYRAKGYAVYRALRAGN